jgi:hypothetical protein
MSQVRAIADFKGAEAGELSFVKGDILTLLEKGRPFFAILRVVVLLTCSLDESGWSKGVLKGVKGWFPSGLLFLCLAFLPLLTCLRLCSSHRARGRGEKVALIAARLDRRGGCSCCCGRNTFSFSSASRCGGDACAHSRCCRRCCCSSKER